MTPTAPSAEICLHCCFQPFLFHFISFVYLSMWHINLQRHLLDTAHKPLTWLDDRLWLALSSATHLCVERWWRLPLQQQHQLPLMQWDGLTSLYPGPDQPALQNLRESVTDSYNLNKNNLEPADFTDWITCKQMCVSPIIEGNRWGASQVERAR